MGTTRRICWIGLGKLGAPMAQKILAAGHELTVWNRTTARAATLVENGAHSAEKSAEAARSADVVFVILSNDHAVRATLLGPEGIIRSMSPGTVLVEMSTISPEISEEVDLSSRARNIAYLRAPVSGSTYFANEPKPALLVSGPKAAYDEVEQLLDLLSTRRLHVGEKCQARILNLAINMMIGTSAAMLGEALALVLKNGIDRGTMLEVIGTSAVASPLFGDKAGSVATRNYSSAVEARMMARDFDLMLDAARASDTPMPLASLVREGWSALLARGDGNADFFKYVELCTDQAGIAK